MAQSRGNGKKRGTQEVPAEIKKYYQSERRDRMWVVWLLSGATFVITVLIVLGLFWGGRWAYNKLRDNNDAAQTTAVEENGNQEGQGSGSSSTDSGNSNDSASDNGSGQTPSSAQQSAQTPVQTPATTPNTGPTTSELPNTGPSSDE